MTWIIYQREYLNIVRKKSFLISTFLVPLGFALLFGIQFMAMMFVEKENYTILVQKEREAVITHNLSSTENLKFEITEASRDSLENRIQENKKEILLILPEKLAIEKTNPSLIFTLYSSGSISENVKSEVRRKVRQAIRTYKIEQAGLTETQLNQLDFELEAQTIKKTKEGSKQTNTFFAIGVGYAVCFLTYMLMAIYGSILMQGIIEEKANRIIEVIVSSVKPFNLLLGKTLAIASVGITQFLLWIILSSMVVFGMGLVMGNMVDPTTLQQPGVSAAESEQMAAQILLAVEQFDWKVLWFVPFYFLGGFFLYGSLFAAAGASVDNIQDAQQFTFPITIPMLLPLLFVFNLIQNPSGSFAVFASIFPFFSPMSMLVRLSLTEVPAYQIILSMLVLIGSFLGCIWIAAKIYRTGILMYGKKPSFKELFHWIRYS